MAVRAFEYYAHQWLLITGSILGLVVWGSAANLTVLEEDFSDSNIQNQYIDMVPTHLENAGQVLETEPLFAMEAEGYVPEITPPLNHPRLWVTPDFLPILRKRILADESQQAWSQVLELALSPFFINVQYSDTTFYSGTIDESGMIEKVIQAKAFYYLITEDHTIGKEAVQLLEDYYKVLNFAGPSTGDISRPMGRSIYIGSLVYDWCYDLMDNDVKEFFRNRMMRIARKMDPGWPPFEESIINGHGNEAQINRDLLAMSIAVYNEDPEPYKFISYLVLEQLVPMRAFEYQSPRHNQGVDYGAYRFGWEMHAAWLFYRMSGQHVFDPNIRKVPYFWQYMKLPGGKMLRDGDRFNVRDTAESYYWKQPFTALLSYAYTSDPHLKAEFVAQGGLPNDPVLYLLLNDPSIEAGWNYDNLLLTQDFGPILGGMISRTGWDLDRSSNDVVMEIKGGGYHFGNHQHADAGALQVYYKGFQIGDLGLYLSYGSTYDFNFNKRSIAHSMMLAVDPEEHVEGAWYLERDEHIDGGTKFNQRFPKTPGEAINDPWFSNGHVVSFAENATPQSPPTFSYFKTDLTSAYTSKISSYTREVVFLNLMNDTVPAAFIMLDNMTTADPSFQKYWQINTLRPPDITSDRILLYNHVDQDTGWTQVQIMHPDAQDFEIDVLSGDQANSTFGLELNIKSDLPEANGHRIMVSPQEENRNDRFLTVFQMTSDTTQLFPVSSYSTGDLFVTVLGQTLVGMSNSTDHISREFRIDPPGRHSYQLILTGLKPGFWNIEDVETGESVNYNVLPHHNVIQLEEVKGSLIVTPQRKYIEE